MTKRIMVQEPEPNGRGWISYYKTVDPPEMSAEELKSREALAEGWNKPFEFNGD